MRRRSTEDDSGSMDSLLDTMTNVVGILVIVLVVTQLGVGDALQRISDTIRVDPLELADKQQRLTAALEKKEQMSVQLELLTTSDESLIDDEIKALREKISRDGPQLENLRQRNQNLAQQREASQREAEQQQKMREELEQKIKDSLTESARLRAVLDRTPETAPPPAKVLKLPDPRPAPDGVRPFRLICANNRIYPLQFANLQKLAQARAAQIVVSKRLLKDPTKGIDPAEFVKEFSRKPFRTEFFEIGIRAGQDRLPKLVLTPRISGGATIKDVERRNSKFNQDLRSLNPSQFYLSFLVCSDSYEIYLKAREVAESNRLLVGWNPQPADWKFAGNMGGDIRLGPPVTPKPDTNPKPPQPPANQKKRNDID